MSETDTIDEPSIVDLETDADKAFRLAHIGGSEAAALLGLSPWDTPWSLYQQKIGAIPPPDFSQLGERQRWGLNLERAIISEVARQTKMDVRKWTQGAISNGLLGGHPDSRRVVGGKTKAMVEIKTVDWLIFRGWNGSPPDHYVLQLLVYMHIAKVDEGMIALLVGGNNLKIFNYEQRPRLMEIIEQKAFELFDRVRRGDPPPVSYEADFEAIQELFKATGGNAAEEFIDLSDDNEVADAIQTYIAKSAIEKEAKKEKEQAGALIKLKGANAGGVICGDWSVKFSYSPEKPASVITADMVGEPIKGRAASRSINPPKFIGEKK